MNAETMMSLNDLAEWLGVAKRTLQTWRSAGTLPEPDLAVGKTVRWRLGTIETWMAERRAARG